MLYKGTDCHVSYAIVATLNAESNDAKRRIVCLDGYRMSTHDCRKKTPPEPTQRIQRKSDPAGSPQRAFQPSQRFNLALPFPFGPCLDPAVARPVPERLELLPNSYCLLLPGRPPLAFALACVSLHSSLQNHFALPVGGFSRCTHPRWNHSRGQSSLSQAIMLPYDTSLQ
jgi:hypothetical protein